MWYNEYGDKVYAYIKGSIEEIGNNYIVVENQGIGYFIYTANPYSFHMHETYTVYVYQHVREDEQTLYGFQTLEDKELFLRLIEVKGLGCKMALPMFATGSKDGIIDAIERENIMYLKKFPKIGDKVARQIILDLKGKLVSNGVESKMTATNHQELVEVLKGLGYKNTDIQKIVPQIDTTISIEEQIKEALKLMLR